MRPWIDLGRVDQVPLRGARKVKTAMGCVAVFRTEGDKVFAISNACPHKAGPLNEGIVHGNKVTCPLHNWVISLETGEVQGNDVGAVEIFPVRVENGRILLDTDRLTSASAA